MTLNDVETAYVVILNESFEIERCAKATAQNSSQFVPAERWHAIRL